MGLCTARELPVSGGRCRIATNPARSSVRGVSSSHLGNARGGGGGGGDLSCVLYL